MRQGIDRLIPLNDFGDRIISYLRFIRYNGRRPADISLLNDYLYHRKTGQGAHDPLQAYVSDKAFLKDYVTARLGPGHNVPTQAVLRSPAEVQSFDFSDRCAIKPTHLSGPFMLRTAGEPVSREVICSWFDKNHYVWTREKNYRYLTPRVIVEDLIFDRTDNADIKFYCYRGRARMVQLDLGRTGTHERMYYNRDWVKLPFSKGGRPMADGETPRPENLDALLQIADRLSADFEFVRVDLYTDGDTILVGELTHCPGSANSPFIPASAERAASDILFGRV